MVSAKLGAVTNQFSSATKHSLLQLNLAVFLFGFTGLFGKWLTLAPLIIVFGRVAFAFVAISLLMIFSRRRVRLRQRRDFGPLLLLGILLAAHWVTFFASIQASSVAICLISFSTAPVLIALMEPLFFSSESFKISNVLVAVVVTIGVAVATPSWSLDNAVTQGILWGLASGLALAFLTLLNRQQVAHYSPFIITFYQMGIVAVLLLPSVWLLHPIVTPHDLTLLAWLGIVFTGAAQLLFLRGLRGVSAPLASIISSGMEVIYGLILAALILHEIPGARTLIGGAIILGATLYAMNSHRESATPVVAV